MIEQYWYRSCCNWVTFLLLPFSWLFQSIVAIRRALYRMKLKKNFHFPVPIIVVGNITVGGTGKTPFVIWLANYLKQQGFHPGIVSRGVGGQQQHSPRAVPQNPNPIMFGDEAVLLSQRTQCPVVIGIDRVLAVKFLLENSACDIVISDDGLQHYRLARDMEIAIVDGARRFGNRCFLPGGPLREPLSRLQEVDFIVTTGESMLLQGDTVISLMDDQKKISLSDFINKTVHAVAAIGNPERFFSSLREKKINIIEHVYPDHFLYTKKDFNFNDQFPIIMTEKDAVKCKEFAEQRFYYLPVSAKIDEAIAEAILHKIHSFSTSRALCAGSRKIGI